MLGKTWKNERIDREVANPSYSGCPAGGSRALSDFYFLPQRQPLVWGRFVSSNLLGGVHLPESLGDDVPISVPRLPRVWDFRHLSTGLHGLHRFYEIQFPKPSSFRSQCGTHSQRNLPQPERCFLQIQTV